MNKYFFYAIFLTFLIHSFLWIKVKEQQIKIVNPPKLVLHSIKSVGEENGKSNSIKLQDRMAGKQLPDLINQKGSKKSISLSDLSDKENLNSNPYKKVQGSRISNISMNKDSIKNLVKNSIANTSAQELIKNLGESDINIKFDIPKGFKIDELNSAELRLYSFQRRTAINYVNTFYKELRDFQTENPHIKFPIVKTPDVMTGRVTYDLNGDVVRIQMVRWSEEKKLQDFFLEMLKELNKLPNPPQELVQNGEFTIYYTLDIKI